MAILTDDSALILSLTRFPIEFWIALASGLLAWIVLLWQVQGRPPLPLLPSLIGTILMFGLYLTRLLWK